MTDGGTAVETANLELALVLELAFSKVTLVLASAEIEAGNFNIELPSLHYRPNSNMNCTGSP